MSDAKIAQQKTALQKTALQKTALQKTAPPAGKKPRGLQKAATNAAILKLRAVATTVDDFGAARFALVHELADGRRDDSAARLRAATGAGRGAGGVAAPFRLCPPGQTIAGEFWARFPKPSALSPAPLAAEYAAARDREVTVEVRPRAYLLGGRRGIALDLVDITPLEAPKKVG